MRRAMLSLFLLAGFVAAEGTASASGLDLRIGGFYPRGHDTLFEDVHALYTPDGDPDHGVAAKDFRGVYGGIEYNAVIARHLELGLSVDGYGKTVDSEDREFLHPDGSPIVQHLKLNMVPLGLTLRVLPTGRNARVVPYLGAGVDAVFYSYEERGEFVDDVTEDIFSNTFQDSGTAFGVHAVGGLRVYLNRDFALVGEGRYQWAKKDMGEDFAPREPGLVNRLDLSGASFTLGMHIRF